jgi:hypothetical protein
MNWISVEGTLEELRAIIDLPGVQHVGRGVTPLRTDDIRRGLSWKIRRSRSSKLKA